MPQPGRDCKGAVTEPQNATQNPAIDGATKPLNPKLVSFRVFLNRARRNPVRPYRT